MPAVTYQLYSPPNGDYTIAYRFKKGDTAGTYEINIEGFGFIGYVAKYNRGWSDSHALNPFLNTRREATEKLLDAWIARRVARAIAKLAPGSRDGDNGQHHR